MIFCRWCADVECPPGSRILPHMDAWLCTSCIGKAAWPIYSEEEITNKVFAPWMKEEAASLTEYQHDLQYLPFVCDNHHQLLVSLDGMYCKWCAGFSLQWAYPWTLNRNWQQ